MKDKVKKKKTSSVDGVIDVTQSIKKKKKGDKVKKERKAKVAEVMPVPKDSYVIVEYQGRNFLALAINPERNRAVLDNSLASDDTITMEYDERTLLAVLGTKPRVGTTAFGVKIQPFVGQSESEYGPFNYFRELSDLEKKALRSALKRTYATMKDNGLSSVFPIGKFNVFPKKGKYAGMYHFRRKGDEVNDTIDLHPMTFEDRKYNEYLLLHEYGHAVWYRLMDSAIKAKWIALYHSRLELANVKKEQLDGMLKDLLHFSGTLKDFLKELPDDERIIFREVLSHIKRYHKLDNYALEILHVENTERFASLWPKRATIIESVKEDPSAYAMTKPEEMFAESFAFHLTGRTLSKDIRVLIKRTLKSL